MYDPTMQSLVGRRPGVSWSLPSPSHRGKRKQADRQSRQTTESVDWSRAVGLVTFDILHGDSLESALMG